MELSLEGASHLYPARVVGRGSVVGLPAAFSGEPYSLTAKTKSACRLDFIPRGKLLDLLRRNPRAGFGIVRMLSEEIFQMRNVAKRGMGMVKPPLIHLEVEGMVEAATRSEVLGSRVSGQ